MNLFENLQDFKEAISNNNTFEQEVDYDILKDNNIDFFENGNGIYRLTTSNGETVDVDIELSDTPTDIPKYFVSLPGDDIRTVNVDLTTALLDIANKIDNNNSPFKNMKRLPKKVTENTSNDIEAGWLDLSKNLKDINNGKYKPSHLLHLLDSETLKLDITKLIEYDEDEHDSKLFNGKYFADWDDYIDSIENVKVESNQGDCDCNCEDNLEESSKTGKLSIGNKLQTIFDNFDSNIKLIGFMLRFIDEDTIEKMYNEIAGVEEATSGIGASSYTTKAIDLKPASSISKVKKINEKIIKVWDDNFDSEEIKKKVDDIKEHPEDIEMGQYFVVKYEDKTYYVIGDDYKYVTIDGIDTAVSIASDDEYNIYALYFKYKYIDYSDGDAENGMTAPDIEVESSPYKIEKIDKA